MTSNRIKLIACISMLIDHIGLILFPQIEIFRWIGRLAMPLFAFCIAEGCRYTKNRTRYFLRMFLLGVGCQAFYTVEQLLSGGVRSVYLNILFTFSFSALLCFAYLDLEKAMQNRERFSVWRAASVFIGGFALLLLFEIFCNFSIGLVGISVTLDYGIWGVILPLFAVIYTDRHRRLFSYAIGLVVFSMALDGGMPYIWLALFDLVILYFYNGKRGKVKCKYAFYIFYPLHLAALYGIDFLLR